jgi:ABC-type sugar transport system substrate-binding protein
MSMTIKGIRVIGQTVFVGLALAQAGCSSSTNDAPNDAPVCTSLPPLAKKASYKVGFAQLYEENGPWRNANTASIQSEAAKRGHELVYDPGTNVDASLRAQDQVKRMEALIAAKVDVIILAPHDETVLAPVVVKARKACIPVFIEDRGVDKTIAIPGVDYVSNLGSDFRQEGVMTAQWLQAKTGGQAKIIEFEGTVGSSPGNLRKEGFDTTITSTPNMTVLESESADFDQQKAHDAALRLIPKNPSATVIYSHNDGMTFGILEAMAELNKVPGKDLLVVSIDGTKKATQDIIDGTVAAVTECNRKFGPLVFDAIEKYANGETLPLEIKNVDRVFDAAGDTSVNATTTSTSAAAYLPEAY